VGEKYYKTGNARINVTLGEFA